MRSAAGRPLLGVVVLAAGFLTACAPADRKVDDDLVEKFRAGSYRAGWFSLPLRYRLFVPAEARSGGRLPLFLFLSSSMGRGFDNRAQLERGAEVLISPRVQGLQPCFVLAPQCPPRSQWLDTSFDTLPFPNYRQDEIPESGTMKKVMGLVEKLLAEHPIDPDRIYVTGDSMGSSGTWDIITRHPHRFAAAITASGVSDPEQAVRIAHLPVWAFHGEADGVSAVQNTRNMVAALRAAGGHVRYTEFAGAGHGIPQVYDEPGLFEWVFAQRRAAKES